MTHPLDVDRPPFLALADSSGAMRYGFTFEHGFGADPSGQVVAPFSWRPGPPGVPGASALKVTASAAVLLLAMPPATRWDRVHQVLQRKYAVEGAYMPSDGRLMITSLDLDSPAD